MYFLLATQNYCLLVNQVFPDAPYSNMWLIVVVTLQIQADQVGVVIIRIVTEVNHWTSNNHLVLPFKDVAA